MQSNDCKGAVFFMTNRLKTFLLTPDTKLHRWEGIFLAMLAIAVLCCGLLSLEQANLAERMVRLHVIANSDAQEDQNLKLQVRDAVLAQASDYLEGVEDAQEAARVLESHLTELAKTGQAVVDAQGYDYEVSATVDVSHFPTKYYEGFALPAGNYRALRVTIGAGEGHNWWCVVFPTLCVSTAADWQDTAVSGGLTEEDVNLMSGADEGYVLRFKCLELLDKLTNGFQGK